MDKDLYCITSNDGETQFFISILEIGWIYDVFLILANEIKSNYEENEYIKVKLNYSGKDIVNGKTYSVFHTFYQFEKPSDFMVAFYIYSIEGVTYVTDPLCFAVEDEKT